MSSRVIRVSHHIYNRHFHSFHPALYFSAASSASTDTGNTTNTDATLRGRFTSLQTLSIQCSGRALNHRYRENMPWQRFYLPPAALVAVSCGYRGHDQLTRRDRWTKMIVPNSGLGYIFGRFLSVYSRRIIDLNVNLFPRFNARNGLRAAFLVCL